MCDILIINETKFNTRAKCPEGFIIIGRSQPSGNKTPRGGVIVYRRTKSNIDAEMITNDFTDCVIIRILPLNYICIAPYIPPNTSKYFERGYFDNLELFLEQFGNENTICIGDINARFGDPPKTVGVSYLKNPDTTINQHGKVLRKIVLEKSFNIVNGLCNEKIICESNFSYFRGNTRSQNDVCLTNNVDTIASFSFGQKLIYSDHKPMLLTIQGNCITNLDTVNQCAMYCFSDEHYDVNRKIKPSIKGAVPHFPNFYCGMYSADKLRCVCFSTFILMGFPKSSIITKMMSMT